MSNDFIEQNIDIHAPREIVWKWLTCPEYQTRWMHGLLSNVPEDPDATEGVGVVSWAEIKEGWKVSKYRIEVTEYDEPDRLTVEMSSGGFPEGMSMVPTYVLTEKGGGTHLNYKCTAVLANPPGFLLKMMMKVGHAFAKRQLDKFLKSLKAGCEAEAAGGGS